MLVLTDPASTLAQERSAITFEGNFGWGTGRTSGEYMNNRDGLTANALVAGRMHRSPVWSVIAGMDASAFGSGPYDAICLPASGGGCIPAFPSFWVFSGLAGIETVRGTLRAMVGAGYARPTDVGGGIALSSRIDAAIPIAGSLSAVCSLRAALLPDVGGDAFQLYALGFGLRLW